MNIFAVDQNPTISAQSLVDRHVVKMILESSQMLCLAHACSKSSNLPSFIWKSTSWKNHPCSKWVCLSSSNYLWLAQHNQSLCNEYTFRYNKIHKLEQCGMVSWLLNNIPSSLTKKNITPFAEATGNIHENDSVSTYKRYYLEHKQHLMVWTKREPPEWIKKVVKIERSGNKWKIVK